jgi:aerobic carbon-monoxide dehydrogenase large subunit
MNEPLPPGLDTATRAGAIGQPVERLEDDRLLRGQGAYVDDLRRPQMLHAAILRSPFAHGRLRAVDAAAARAMPGVHAVLTAAEVRAHRGGRVPLIPMRLDALPELAAFEQPVIADDRVRYVGEPLAVVVAESLALAEDALEAIEVDIEALPPVVSGGVDAAACEQAAVALFESTPSNRALRLWAERGDAAAAFASAAYVRRERFSVQRHAASPMETRGVLAEHDADAGTMTVWGASKVPFANRRILAGLLELPLESVRMLEGDTGGSFGARGEFYPEDFLVPFAAMHCRRPVKWIEDRREHLTACNHARDAEGEIEIACSRDGQILALRGQVATDVGAYMRTNGIAQSRNIVQIATGPYRIAHVDMRLSVMLSNKTPAGTYRGPGRYETDFFRERLLDLAAADLGIDRVEFRRRNLLTRDEMPWDLPRLQPYDSGSRTDSGDYHETFELCLREFDWAQKTAINGRLIDGRHHGIAIGCYIEGGGSGPREGARIVLEADGRYAVYTGSSANGQGLRTVLTQIAADALDCPMSAISGVFHGSTTLVREGFGAYSSRSVVMGGSAIVTVAQTLKERILAAAATELDCEREAIVQVGDRLLAPSGRALSLAELAQSRAAGGGPGAELSAEGSFASSQRTYSYGAHAAHVAVDARTGAVTVLDYLAVEDVGRIINPHTLHGQTVGAVVQGLGGVFLEHLAYDEQGQLLTGSFADYLLPTASDYPPIRAIALENYPSPHNPLGAKGAGEGGIIAVAGVIANAVSQALGVSVRALPLSPSRLWQLAGQARLPDAPRATTT